MRAGFENHDSDAIRLIDILIDCQLKFGKRNDIEFDVFLVGIEDLENILQFIDDGIGCIWRSSKMDALDPNAASKQKISSDRRINPA